MDTTPDEDGGDSDGGDGELNWSPKAKVVFTDAELVAALRASKDVPGQRTGNWFAFFSALPKPEQERLEKAANSR